MLADKLKQIQEYITQKNYYLAHCRLREAIESLIADSSGMNDEEAATLKKFFEELAATHPSDRDDYGRWYRDGLIFHIGDSRTPYIIAPQDTIKAIINFVAHSRHYQNSEESVLAELHKNPSLVNNIALQCIVKAPISRDPENDFSNGIVMLRDNRLRRHQQIKYAIDLFELAMNDKKQDPTVRAEACLQIIQAHFGLSKTPDALKEEYVLKTCHAAFGFIEQINDKLVAAEIVKRYTPCLEELFTKLKHNSVLEFALTQTSKSFSLTIQVLRSLWKTDKSTDMLTRLASFFKSLPGGHQSDEKSEEKTLSVPLNTITAQLLCELVNELNEYCDSPIPNLLAREHNSQHSTHPIIKIAIDFLEATLAGEACIYQPCGDYYFRDSKTAKAAEYYIKLITYDGTTFASPYVVQRLQELDKTSFSSELQSSIQFTLALEKTKTLTTQVIFKKESVNTLLYLLNTIKNLDQLKRAITALAKIALVLLTKNPDLKLWDNLFGKLLGVIDDNKDDFSITDVDDVDVRTNLSSYFDTILEVFLDHQNAITEKAPHYEKLLFNIKGILAYSAKFYSEQNKPQEVLQLCEQYIKFSTDQDARVLLTLVSTSLITYAKPFLLKDNTWPSETKEDKDSQISVRAWQICRDWSKQGEIICLCIDGRIPELMKEPRITDKQKFNLDEKRFLLWMNNPYCISKHGTHFNPNSGKHVYILLLYLQTLTEGNSANTANSRLERISKDTYYLSHNSSTSSDLMSLASCFLKYSATLKEPNNDDILVRLGNLYIALTAEKDSKKLLGEFETTLKKVVEFCGCTAYKLNMDMFKRFKQQKEMLTKSLSSTLNPTATASYSVAPTTTNTKGTDDLKDPSSLYTNASL